MKLKLMAGAALALVSGMAAAQSAVTVYGNLDVGVLTQNHAPAGTASTTMASGGISPSIFGVRGTEDLGGGLNASFNLEGHFAPDTGEKIGPAGTLFRRQSNVGLSGGFGKVTLGNMYSPAILAFAATDPRGLRENFSGLYSWAYNSGALTAGNNGNNDVGVFLQNAIAYSNTIGPVGVAGSYSLSEDKGAVYSLGATYAGPVSLSAAYQSTNAPDTSERISRIYTVGAAYTMGAFTGKLNFLRGENRNAVLVDTSKVNVIGAGVDWKTSSNNTATAAVYFGKDKDDSTNKTTTFLLSDEYALSKRTSLYGQLAYARTGTFAGINRLMTSVVAGGTAANTNTSLLNVGIKHSF